MVGGRDGQPIIEFTIGSRSNIPRLGGERGNHFSPMFGWGQATISHWGERVRFFGWGEALGNQFFEFTMENN